MYLLHFGQVLDQTKKRRWNLKHLEMYLGSANMMHYICGDATGMSWNMLFDIRCCPLPRQIYNEQWEATSVGVLQHSDWNVLLYITWPSKKRIQFLHLLSPPQKNVGIFIMILLQKLHTTPSDLIRCGWWGWSPCSGDIRIKSLPWWVLRSLKEYNLNHACPSSQGGNVFFSVFAVFF